MKSPKKTISTSGMHELLHTSIKNITHFSWFMFYVSFCWGLKGVGNKDYNLMEGFKATTRVAWFYSQSFLFLLKSFLFDSLGIWTHYQISFTLNIHFCVYEWIEGTYLQAQAMRNAKAGRTLHNAAAKVAVVSFIPA